MLFLNRTVLSIMDDALYVYTAGFFSSVEFKAKLPWDDEAFVNKLSVLIDRECKGNPVVLLHDMIEQYYRKERIFTAGVGSLDKNMMISRKLAMVFPSYSIRAFVPLKKSKNDGPDAEKSDVFLFMAISNSQSLAMVINAIKKSQAHFLGIGLLPYESVTMVDSLADKLTSSNKNKAEWTLFLGQQKNGNVRQIVTKNGEVALTRMTQVIDAETSSAKHWAIDVAKELQATMNYLGRLAFQADDGLNLILIADEDKGVELGKIVEGKFDFFSVTQQKAASLLNIKIGKGVTDSLSDYLHVGWMSKKITLDASLPLVSMDSVAQTRLAVSALSLFMGVGLFFSAYNLLGTAQKKIEATESYERHARQLRQVQVQYNKESDELSDTGLDLPLVQATHVVLDDLKKGNPDIVDMIKIVSDVVGQENILSDFTLNVSPQALSLGDKKSSLNLGARLEQQRNVRS